MPGGTNKPLRRVNTKEVHLELLQDGIDESLRDSQVDIIRNGRELSGVRRAGISIPAGGALEIAHGLGRHHRGGWCCRPMSFGATAVSEDPTGITPSLANTHIRLVNSAGVGNDATFYWWVY